MRALVASVVLALSASAQEPAIVPSSVEGVVIDARTGEPIPGASVVPLPYNGVGAVTDMKGAFTLDKARSGRIEFRVSAPQHVGQSFTIDVAAGERLNSVLFRLGQTGVISGRVVDSNGQPMAGIIPQTMVYTHSFPGSNSIEISNADQADVTLHPLDIGRNEGTDDHGEFRIYDVPPGQYYLRIAPKNNTPGIRPVLGVVLYPGFINLSDAIQIKVSAGEQVRLTDVTLAPSTLGWITAHVTNALGETPTVLSGGYGLTLNREGEDNIESTKYSGANGPSAIRPDAPGQYVVCAYMPIDGGAATSCRSVDYTGADVNLNFTVTKPDARFAGRILVEQADGVIGKPLQKFSISTDMLDIHGSRLRIENNSDGTFSESGLYTGQGRITALTRYPGQGNPNYFLASVHQGDRDVLTDGMTISNRDSNVEILISIRGGVLRGTVKDESGNRVPNAKVALVPEDELARRSDKADTYRTGQSDINGVYEIRGLIPGSYRAYSAPRPEGWAYWDSRYMKKFEGFGKSIRIEKDSKASVDLSVITIAP